MKLNFLVILLVIFNVSISNISIFAEDSFNLKIKEELYFSSTNSMPHYLKANKWGLLNNETFQANTIINASKSYTLNNDWSFDLGLETGFGLSENPDLKLSELYGQINYKFLEFFIGKKKHTQGHNPIELSGGSMTVSPNASPIPKIYVGLSDFITVPHTAGFLQVYGNISNGWLQGDRYIKGVYLHEKSFFLRVNSKVGLLPYGGIVHEALWGGEFAEGERKGESLSDLSLSNIGKIFLAKSGGEDAAVEGEKINKLGNHLGAWEFGIYGFYDIINFQFYYQHFFEDASGKGLENEYDGLWGITFQPNKINYIDNMLFEILTTLNQSGEYHDINGEILGGRDSYYDHYIYKNGWTHLNHIIGNSFFSTSGEDSNLRVSSNRIQAYQFGINGTIINKFNYKSQIAYANYYPAYSEISKYSKKEFMCYLYNEVEVEDFITENISFKIGIAYDFGSLKNSFGILSAFEWSL